MCDPKYWVYVYSVLYILYNCVKYAMTLVSKNTHAHQYPGYQATPGFDHVHAMVFMWNIEKTGNPCPCVHKINLVRPSSSFCLTFKVL